MEVVSTGFKKYQKNVHKLASIQISPLKTKPDLFYYPQMKTSDYIDAQQYLCDQGKYNSWFKDKYYNPQLALLLMYNKKNGNITDSEFNDEINKHSARGVPVFWNLT